MNCIICKIINDHVREADYIVDGNSICTEHFASNAAVACRQLQEEAKEQRVKVPKAANI